MPTNRQLRDYENKLQEVMAKASDFGYVVVAFDPKELEWIDEEDKDQLADHMIEKGFDFIKWKTPVFDRNDHVYTDDDIPSWRNI